MSGTEEQQSKQVVEDFIEVFSKGDVEGILDALTDDATWWIMGSIEGISGTQDKKLFGQMFAQLSQLIRGGAVKMTPQAWTVQGDRVAVECESYAELTDGRIYNNKYHFLFTVRDGKISGVREYSDTEHLRATFLP